MSSPLSTIVVQTRMSILPAENSDIVFSSADSVVRLCAIAMLSFGKRRLSMTARSCRSFILLWTKNIWPPLFFSRSTAFFRSSSEKGRTTVMTGSLRCGGVCSIDMSRSPLTESESERGIGVAESISTSTPGIDLFRWSLCMTPKRCSSSTIIRPRSLNLTSSVSIR
ncbi:hypothetical protein SDC9_166797 [bioreactor metagenome]|uniref:Uncharacterized protein n=1 Tax=bioreactor metagenome TaxID=1076179 RepID=A0A645FY07_9ZZZZ